MFSNKSFLQATAGLLFSTAALAMADTPAPATYNTDNGQLSIPLLEYNNGRAEVNGTWVYNLYFVQGAVFSQSSTDPQYFTLTDFSSSMSEFSADFLAASALAWYSSISLQTTCMYFPELQSTSGGKILGTDYGVLISGFYDPEKRSFEIYHARQNVVTLLDAEQC